MTDDEFRENLMIGLTVVLMIVVVLGKVMGVSASTPTVPQALEAWSDPTDGCECLYARFPTRVRGIAIDEHDPRLVIISLAEDTA